MKLQSITDLRQNFEWDIACFEQKMSEDMRFARDIEGIGLCWPLDWFDNVEPEIKDKWNKFMDGQTFCSAGFYERDIRRFIYGVMRDEVSPELPETD
jgi:hypothetical protein